MFSQWSLPPPSSGCISRSALCANILATAKISAVAGQHRKSMLHMAARRTVLSPFVFRSFPWHTKTGQDSLTRLLSFFFLAGVFLVWLCRHVYAVSFSRLSADVRPRRSACVDRHVERLPGRAEGRRRRVRHPGLHLHAEPGKRAGSSAAEAQRDGFDLCRVVPSLLFDRTDKRCLCFSPQDVLAGQARCCALTPVPRMYRLVNRGGC